MLAKKKEPKKTTAKAAPNKKKPTLKQKPAAGVKKKTAVKKSPAKKKTSPSHTRTKNLPIVGIGASAGGLKALETFFDNISSNCGMSFVVIQHLSTGHKSIMGTLLEKHTKMKVLPAEDNTKLQPNCIYLNPPDKNIGIINGILQLMVPRETHSVNLPINFFFRSLSEDQKESAICIVLSGTGTDGTMGLRAVKAEGGMTMVQDEKDAEYNGMPKSAIDTGLVDFILPANKMAAQLMKYVKHPYMHKPGKKPELLKKYDDYVQKIYLLIRAKTGHDFSHYKKNTIYRRIERRMAVHQIDRIVDYVRLLTENPSEIETLFRDMLITVTNFFRDPDAFKVLEQKAIPELVKNRSKNKPLRVWITGCATGEEAYSIAMLITENMERLKEPVTVQIFATDIDEEAIEYARAATYPDSIAADVSPGRLKRFFFKEENTFRIKKQIREMVVFANQSLTKDPPFSKLDMVVCRNVLIYMDSALQKIILPLFHYTLNSDGILFLGSSESIGAFMDHFAPIDTKWKIFKRRDTELPRAMEYPGTQPGVADSDIRSKGKLSRLSELDIRDIAEMVILEKYGPPCVLVNNKHEILYFSGNTDKYLSPPVGVPNFDILKMVNEGLLYKLSSSMHKVSKQKKSIVCRDLQIKHHNTYITVDLTIMPIAAHKAREDLMMVVFEDKTLLETTAKDKKAAKPKQEESRISILEQELQSTKEYLQTTIEELETTNEELKSTNEEMQSTNEELQSTNEELETSKEEMQSTNEELSTVNAELQTKVDELSWANNDLNNLFSSTEIGTIFLDMQLCIKRFTPSMGKIFNLIKTDIGRPISDLTAKTNHENILADSEKVLKTLNTLEKYISVKTGETYNMRIMPYRTLENVIDGIVLTFSDITTILKAEKNIRFATVLKDSNDAITIQDNKGNISAWNRGAELMYGYTEAEAIKMNIKEIVPDDEKKYALKFVKDVFAGKQINSFKAARKTRDGREIVVWLTVTILRNKKGQPVSVATTERDITKLKELKELKE